MIDRRSRYFGTPIVETVDGRGERQPLLDLRVGDVTGGVLELTPTGGDRLDLLAYRFYRDPTAFWRICDASTEVDPFAVLEPGAPISIPPGR